MDKEEKREFIIEASRELFARFGLKKTTMDEIAKKCGMSKATLYYYFEGKEDVFRAVMNKEFNIFKGKMGEALSKAETPHDKLRAFVVTRSIHLKELANHYSTLKDEYLEHYAFVEPERLKFTDWEIQMVQSILDEGVQQGVFDIYDSKLTAAALVYSLKGLEYPWTVEKDIIEIGRAINLMLPILFKGIEKR